MSLAGFVLIFCSVTLSALGQTFFKAGVDRVAFAEGAGMMNRGAALVLSPWVLGGLAFYGVGTVLWLFALKRMDLSLAYPFVAMSFVMVAASGVLFLGETLSVTRVLGMALIVSGLCVMAFGR